MVLRGPQRGSCGASRRLESTRGTSDRATSERPGERCDDNWVSIRSSWSLRSILLTGAVELAGTTGTRLAASNPAEGAGVVCGVGRSGLASQGESEYDIAPPAPTHL